MKKQIQFGDNGDLVVYEAKRFSPIEERNLLEALTELLPYHKVEETDAITSGDWGVLEPHKKFLIIPKTESAKRFMARFWDGHQKSDTAIRGQNPIFEPFYMGVMSNFFMAINEEPTIKVDRGTIRASSRSFDFHLIPKIQERKKKPLTIATKIGGT